MGGEYLEETRGGHVDQGERDEGTTQTGERQGIYVYTALHNALYIASFVWVY